MIHGDAMVWEKVKGRDDDPAMFILAVVRLIRTISVVPVVG